MAEITPILQTFDGEGNIFLWEEITPGDTCAPIAVNERQVEITVAAFGTFGGATLDIKGTLIPSQVDAVDDVYGIAMSYTSDSGLKGLGPAVSSFFPAITGGSGSDIDVIAKIVSKRA